MKNSIKSKQKYTSITEIFKINLDVENGGVLGVKRTKKEGKLGEIFEGILMCPEFAWILMFQKSMEHYNSKKRLWKLTWMMKLLVAWG